MPAPLLRRGGGTAAAAARAAASRYVAVLVAASCLPAAGSSFAVGGGSAPPALGGGGGWTKGGTLDGFSRSARRPTRTRPSGMRLGRVAAACGVMLLRRRPRCWPRRRAARVGERGRSGPQRTVAGGRGARGGRFAPLPWIPGIAVWHGGLPAACRWSSALSAYRQISGKRGRDVWAGRFARYPCLLPPRPRSLLPARVRCPRSLRPRRPPAGSAPAAARPPGPQTPLIVGGYPKIWSI